ncbi:hypothetical protein M2347_000909 [Chryseobacterium sp. H1D6B]|nr:hypothetical protein [Chryseobacterium sp. H1D6B]
MRVRTITDEKTIVKKRSEKSIDKKILFPKKTNTEISNSFFQRIISLLKKEELI